MPRHNMSQAETKRLLAFSWAKKHSPRQAVKVTSRRTSKSANQAVGMKFLKDGGIVSEVPLEKHFIKRR